MKYTLLILFNCIILNLSAQDLKQHQWNNRVLIIYTEEHHNELFQDQLKVLKGKEEALAERKFILYQINKEEYRSINYVNNKETKGESTLNKLIQNKSFEILLIGLDGGVKLRKNNILTIEELSNIVDAMPMRRSEMRK